MYFIRQLKANSVKSLLSRRQFAMVLLELVASSGVVACGGAPQVIQRSIGQWESVTGVSLTLVSFAVTKAAYEILPNLRQNGKRKRDKKSNSIKVTVGSGSQAKGCY
jgi:ABC-type sulfate transport system substrate-binding protein